MSGCANPLRGEASIVIAGRERILRPTFAALVERAGAGQLRLAEVAALFWHCLVEHEAVGREVVGEAVLAHGLAASARPLQSLLRQILQGAG